MQSLSEAKRRKVSAFVSGSPYLKDWPRQLDLLLDQLRRGEDCVNAAPYLSAIDSLAEAMIVFSGTRDELIFEEDAASVARHFRSTRFGNSITLGLDANRRSTFLDFQLLVKPMLYRVVPEFWEHAAALERLADSVVFMPHVEAVVPVDPAVANALRRPRSSTFHLAAHCALQLPDDYLDHGGSLELHWGWSRTPTDIATGMIESFKRLTRMNWCIYRVAYEDAHGKRNDPKIH